MENNADQGVQILIAMPKTIKVNKDKILNQLTHLERLAVEGGWVYNYDSDLDSLYYSPPEISKGFFLYSVGNEFSLYVNGNSRIGGVFIEYYSKNLASHEAEFKPFKSVFTKKYDGFTTIPDSDKAIAIQLSETLKAELLSKFITDSSVSVS